MRSFLLATAFLILGFAAGWVARPADSQAIVVPVQAASKKSQVVATPAATANASREVAPIVERRDSSRNRADSVRWLRQSGINMNLPLLNGADVNPGTAKVLGLTEQESKRINDAAHAAKARIDALREAKATPRLSDDGHTLVVDLPALDPAASGTIYDDLFGTVKSTLGPERLDLFTELSGESFDQSFDRYGLNSVRYELNLQPTYFPNGNALLQYKRHYVDAGGNSTGWSGSQQTIDGLARTDPILAKFIPAQLKQPKGKP